MTAKRLLVALLVVASTLVGLAPTASATAITVAALAGKWEFVGWANPNPAEDEAVDIVRLDLVDFPAGHLSGTWEETALPRYASIALNGTECLGCNGPPSTYWNEFDVTGETTASFFILTVANERITATGSVGSQFRGGLGRPPAAARAYGCTPASLRRLSTLFLIESASAYVFFRFFRPNAYKAASVGAQIHPLCI
jgi:hypothetical protein